jgi:hypothetical protein
MFGIDAIGLRAGEMSDSSFDDELVYQLTVAEAKKPLSETRQQLVVDELELLPPGIFLAAAIHRVQRRRVGGHNLIRVLKARERLVSHYQAEVASDMAEVAHLAPGDDWHERSEHEWDYASDEIRAALTLTRRGAETRLAFALHLAHDYPKVLDALAAGVIDHARARVIVEGVANLPLDTALAVVDEVIDKAPRVTTGQLLALIRRLTIDLDPKQAKERYESAVDNRRIWIEQTPDGTANLFAFDLPVDRVRSIGRRINGYVFSLSGRDDRTHDQLRADVLLDLLDGTATGQPGTRATVDIRVDLATLAGLNDHSAQIPGFGPVIADIARQIAERPETHWRYTAVDEQGNALTAGITRRRHTTAQRRAIEMLHQTCVFPGCRMPANDCDIDHNLPWARGGPTTVANGTPKCRHDHRLRHEGGWDYRFLEGRHQWTSPLGHTYITERPPP